MKVLKQLVSILLPLSAFPSLARAAEPFQCAAKVGSVTYTVELSGPDTRRDMSVSRSDGPRYFGRASAYRKNTRFFLPTSTNQGIKLGVDGTSASICFGNGGSNCHPCNRIASNRNAGRYRIKRTCQGPTSTGFIRASTYYLPYTPTELVVENETGEIASGAATTGVYVETIHTLRTGPSDALTYFADANVICPSNPYDCFECSQSGEDFNETPNAAPYIVEAQCIYNGSYVWLLSREGERSIYGEYHQRDLGLGSSRGNFTGPATEVAPNSWIGAGASFQILGASGAVCTAQEGCGTCTLTYPATVFFPYD